MARSDLSKTARAVAAKGGLALPNGKYPIRTRRELKAAIKLRHHSTEPYAKVRSHIMKRAAALGVKLKPSQVASAGPGMTVFACYEKACAPPPAGKGGSSRGKGGMNKTQVRDYKGREVEHQGKTVTIKGSRMVEKSGGSNVTMVRVTDRDGNEFEVSSRKLRIPTGHPVITAAEARGDSKPVSRAEFQRLASIGQAKLDALSANSSPITGLDAKWGKVKDDSYAEVVKPWGGATIDSHTGQALPQGANKFALTVKEKGGDTVSVPENASKAEFDAAMDTAKQRFRHILEREDHHLGVFHDDDLKRIDIDPVLVVDKVEDVHTIGAATRAIGGAYNFSDGNGYWPPHVAEEG